MSPFAFPAFFTHTKLSVRCSEGGMLGRLVWLRKSGAASMHEGRVRA